MTRILNVNIAEIVLQFIATILVPAYRDRNMTKLEQCIKMIIKPIYLQKILITKCLLLHLKYQE